jgi:hypothetical protein
MRQPETPEADDHTHKGPWRTGRTPVGRPWPAHNSCSRVRRDSRVKSSSADRAPPRRLVPLRRQRRLLVSRTDDRRRLPRLIRDHSGDQPHRHPWDWQGWPRSPTGPSPVS